MVNFSDVGGAYRGGDAIPPLPPKIRVGAVILIAVMIVVVGTVVAVQQRHSLHLSYLAFLAYCVILSLPLFLAPRWGLLHPVIFFVLWNGLGQLLRGDVLLAAIGIEYHRALPYFPQAKLDAVVGKSFLLESSALVGLYLGFLIMPRLRVPRLRALRGRAVELKGCLLLLISALAVLMITSKGGGIGDLLLERGRASDQRIAFRLGSHWHYLASVATVFPAVSLAFKPSSVRRMGYWFILAGSIVLSFVATGSRSGVIVPLIAAGLIWILRSGQIPYKVVFAGAAATLVMLGALGGFRVATRGADDLRSIDYEVSVVETFLAGIRELADQATSNSGQLAILGRVPAEVDYLYGRSYLSIPYAVIPSRLSGEKPDAAGKLNAALIYGNPLSGIPAKPVGEAYWNFSYAGPFLIFLFYGVILKSIWAFSKPNLHHPIIAVLYVYVLLFLTPSSNDFYNFIHEASPAILFGLVAGQWFRRQRNVELVPMLERRQQGPRGPV
jgi:oligosaccharide repeat unit polymerase